MANRIDYTLDVFATSPKEIDEVTHALVQFKVVHNLGYVDEDLNKARRFETSYQIYFHGQIAKQLCQVSQSFPNAVFLAYFYDIHGGWARKEVIRNGVVERFVWDRKQRAQMREWMLLDIFAPFLAEYETGQPFGSMWNEWVDDLMAAADELRNANRLDKRSKRKKSRIESSVLGAVEK